MLTQHLRESLQVTPGPFPDFWVGPGDEAGAKVACMLAKTMPLAWKYVKVTTPPFAEEKGVAWVWPWTPSAVGSCKLLAMHVISGVPFLHFSTYQSGIIV